MQPGDRIGSYEIVAPIAAGGMGVVYQGRHVTIGRDVAIKVLLPNLMLNERVRARFAQEAYVQGQLYHPNIVNLTDAIQEDSVHALVMEWVQGGTLGAYLDTHSTPMTEQDFRGLFAPIVEAVAYAHGRELIHRDIKPDNILLTPEGIPKVTDFGIAKMLEDDSHFTKTGSKMGTYPFMAPEQFRGESDLGKEADVFALGMLAWRMLTGKLPVDPENMEHVLKMYTGMTPLPSVNDMVEGLSPGLIRLVDSCLSLDTEKRPRDAVAMVRLLDGLGTPLQTETLAPEEQNTHVLSSEPESTSSIPETQPQDDDLEALTRPPRSRLPWVLTILAIMGIAGWWMSSMGSDQEESPENRTAAVRSVEEKVVPPASETETVPKPQPVARAPLVPPRACFDEDVEVQNFEGYSSVGLASRIHSGIPLRLELSQTLLCHPKVQEALQRRSGPIGLRLLTEGFNQFTLHDCIAPFSERLCHLEGAFGDHFGEKLPLFKSLQLFRAGPGFSDVGMQHLKELSKMRTLFLKKTQVTDQGLAHLAGLFHLRKIALSDTPVNGSGFVHFSGMTGLQELVLNRTRVDDQGLAHLRTIESLIFLWLYQANVTSQGIESLRGMPNLRELDLSETRVDDGAGSALSTLFSLEKLYLSHTSFTDWGLSNLSGLANLKVLSVRGTGLTNAGMGHFRNLYNLERLSVRDTRITNYGLEPLLRLSNLKILDVLGTSVDRYGALLVGRALPRCEVKFD